MTNEPARERDIVERLADAADENLHLVWYRGHPLPLIGAPDGVHFILRSSPYGDTFALANEVNFALPFTRLREQLDWPNDAAFQLGDLVQKKGRASWRGRVVGWYRTDLTALGFAVESDFEPGSVQIYPQTALEPREQIEAPVSDAIVEAGALRLCEIYDQQRIEDGKRPVAVVAYRAGSFAVPFWNEMAKQCALAMHAARDTGK